jgi:hypothetical protein
MTYGNYSVYSLWRTWYLKAKFAKVTVPDDAFKMVHPNFRGHFKDLDPADSSELEDHSIKGKKKIVKESMLKSKGFITIKSIAQQTGYSIDSIRKYTKKHSMKGEKHSNTLYYHNEIVEDIVRRKANGEGISI